MRKPIKAYKILWVILRHPFRRLTFNDYWITDYFTYKGEINFMSLNNEKYKGNEQV